MVATGALALAMRTPAAGVQNCHVPRLQVTAAPPRQAAHGRAQCPAMRRRWTSRSCRGCSLSATTPAWSCATWCSPTRRRSQPPATRAISTPAACSPGRRWRQSRAAPLQRHAVLLVVRALRARRLRLAARGAAARQGRPGDPAAGRCDCLRDLQLGRPQAPWSGCWASQLQLAHDMVLTSRLVAVLH